jgi:hypothetical protein
MLEDTLGTALAAPEQNLRCRTATDVDETSWRRGRVVEGRAEFDIANKGSRIFVDLVDLEDSRAKLARLAKLKQLSRRVRKQDLIQHSCQSRGEGESSVL